MRLPEITFGDFLKGVLMVTVMIITVWSGIGIGNAFEKARSPQVFSGTISDMEEIDNYILFWDTPNDYKLVIVNGTEELRITFHESDIEQRTFGKLENELIFKVGDNVTVTKVNFTKKIELQN